MNFLVLLVCSILSAPALRADLDQVASPRSLTDRFADCTLQDEVPPTPEECKALQDAVKAAQKAKEDAETVVLDSWTDELSAKNALEAAQQNSRAAFLDFNAALAAALQAEAEFGTGSPEHLAAVELKNQKESAHIAAVQAETNAAAAHGLAKQAVAVAEEAHAAASAALEGAQQELDESGCGNNE